MHAIENVYYGWSVIRNCMDQAKAVGPIGPVGELVDLYVEEG